MSTKEYLLNLALGYQASQAIFTAVKIGLLEQPESFECEWFADAKGLSKDGVARLVLFLERLGIVKSVGNGQYIVNSEVQQILIGERLIDFLKHQSNCWENWTQLDAMLNHKHSRGSQAWLANDLPRAKLFASALHSISGAIAKRTIAELKEMWRLQPRTILDVGGGLGSFAYACQQAWEQSDIAIMEQGCVAEVAKDYGNIPVIEGDVRDEKIWGEKKWDLIVMSQILSPLDISDRNITLSHAKTHLSQNGAILLVDFFDDSSTLGSARFGLHMWIVSETGGTLKLNWLKQFCAENNFRLIRLCSSEEPLPILLQKK